MSSEVEVGVVGEADGRGAPVRRRREADDDAVVRGQLVVYGGLHLSGIAWKHGCQKGGRKFVFGLEFSSTASWHFKRNWLGNGQAWTQL